VEADAIISATVKAQKNDAWFALSDEQRASIGDAVSRLQLAQMGTDHAAIRAEIDHLNEVTHSLAEQMMNTAVSSALKGTRV
jgi:molecular chaperone DnaK (HSP70)